jgi:hypothetical protein
MQEFMFYIRNAADAKSDLSAEDHLAFVKKCEIYIAALKSKNQLIAAQPIARAGTILKKVGEEWQNTPVISESETQVGYYHVRANNLNEAVEMAKKNPEFEYVPSASIEVRPIKMKEETTGFVYPNKE